MIGLNQLKPPAGARQNFKRVGRGRSSGKGKTSGRGQKGQNSRTGGGVRLGFEGGQMPLARRSPKKGFKNPFPTHWTILSLEKLNAFSDNTEVNPQMLMEKGLIKTVQKPVKILANGEITKRITVKAQAFSKGAKEKIEK